MLPSCIYTILHVYLAIPRLFALTSIDCRPRLSRWAALLHLRLYSRQGADPHCCHAEHFTALLRWGCQRHSSLALPWRWTLIERWRELTTTLAPHTRSTTRGNGVRRRHSVTSIRLQLHKEIPMR